MKLKGKSEIWWSFGSTTDSIEVLTNEMFLGDKGERTMFLISAQTVRDISRYSAISTEKEYLFLPATVVVVESILPQGELTVIQLKEKIDPRLAILSTEKSPRYVEQNSPRYDINQHSLTVKQTSTSNSTSPRQLSPSKIDPRIALLTARTNLHSQSQNSQTAINQHNHPTLNQQDEVRNNRGERAFKIGNYSKSANQGNLAQYNHGLSDCAGEGVTQASAQICFKLEEEVKKDDEISFENLKKCVSEGKILAKEIEKGVKKDDDTPFDLKKCAGDGINLVQEIGLGVKKDLVIPVISKIWKKEKN
jgi:hypothetical protein